MKSQKRLKAQLIIYSILIILLLASCTDVPPLSPSNEPSPAVSPFTSPTQAEGTGAVASPLPTPAPIPTPSAGKTTITGVLMTNTSAPRPAAGALLYLAAIYPNDAGTPTLAGFDRIASPRTQTDEAGRFVFADVPVEMYTLILDRVAESYLLKDPENASDMIFTPEAGEILDVGELIYSTLPGEAEVP